MNDHAGRYFVLDGSVKDGSEPVHVDTASGRTAYEVMRVLKGVPLFYEDHYDRLVGTFRSIGIPLDMSAGQLKEHIRKLLSANKTDACNVKVVMFEEDGRQRQLVYISKSYYPSQEEGDIGTKTGLFRIERSNPNAKLINQAYKDAVSAKINEGGFFEVLLVDSWGRITEGSRSNAFFVVNGEIRTAPGEFVLKGITRKYVCEACKNAGYEVKEQFVEADSLSQVEGAFLSGTSIKVFPINTVDHITLNSSVNPVVDAVRQEYDKLLEKYIDENVKLW